MASGNARPLGGAIASGDAAVVRLLLDRGADPARLNVSDGTLDRKVKDPTIRDLIRARRPGTQRADPKI